MSRIVHLDYAKAIAIILVYYGHFVERLVQNGVDNAFVQQQFIYSMHVPFFFFLAGVFWTPVGKSFLDLIKERLVPVLFFNLLLIPLWFTIPLPLDTFLNILMHYLSGKPTFNWVTWFLICLFVIECILNISARFFTMEKRSNVVIHTVGFLVLGLALIRYADYIKVGASVDKSFWFIDVAVIAAPFYLSGYLLKKQVLREFSPQQYSLIAIMLGGLFLMCFNLNPGPFSSTDSVVILALSSIGHPFYFYLTAGLGSFVLIALCGLMPKNIKPLSFVGKNTIIYLGLNGLCFHFIDVLFIRHLNYYPSTTLEILTFSGAYTVGIMFCFAPLVYLLRTYFPKLVGFPRTKQRK